jgi:hypothetical protein
VISNNGSKLKTHLWQVFSLLYRYPAFGRLWVGRLVLLCGDPARDFINIYEDYGSILLEEVLHVYTGEQAPKMMSEVRKWYLLEAISWTVKMCGERRYVEMDEGLTGIRRELAIVASQDL